MCTHRSILCSLIARTQYSPLRILTASDRVSGVVLPLRILSFEWTASVCTCLIKFYHFFYYLDWLTYLYFFYWNRNILAQSLPRAVLLRINVDYDVMNRFRHCVFAFQIHPSREVHQFLLSHNKYNRIENGTNGDTKEKQNINNTNHYRLKVHIK